MGKPPPHPTTPRLYIKMQEPGNMLRLVERNARAVMLARADASSGDVGLYCVMESPGGKAGGSLRVILRLGADQWCDNLRFRAPPWTGLAG